MLQADSDVVNRRFLVISVVLAVVILAGLVLSVLFGDRPEPLLSAVTTTPRSP